MTRKKYVVVVSDCRDVAYNEMRRRVISECEKLGNYDVNVEPLVSAREFSIINGAFLTRLMADLYPSGTIYMVILNPLKDRPARIFGETLSGHVFEGANTGTLNWLIEDFGLKELYEIRDPGYFPFGGKYIHAPTVAKIASGVPYEEIGERRDRNFLIDFAIDDGTIVHIDNFGLMKIKGETPQYKNGSRLKIYVNGKETVEAIYTKRMMSLDDGMWVLYPGSSLNHMPELGKVRCKDGAEVLGVKIGDKISWEVIE
jgi:S-adenosylmethionine hydrolase